MFDLLNYLDESHALLGAGARCCARPVSRALFATASVATIASIATTLASSGGVGFAHGAAA